MLETDFLKEHVIGWSLQLNRHIRTSRRHHTSTKKQVLPDLNGLAQSQPRWRSTLALSQNLLCVLLVSKQTQVPYLLRGRAVVSGCCRL